MRLPLVLRAENTFKYVHSLYCIAHICSIFESSTNECYLKPSASAADPESGLAEGQDDDEDKYRKKSVWRMFEAMGLV